MIGKYLRKIGGLALTALMLFGIGFVSTSEMQAQRRQRVIIIRPHRIYRPFGFRRWGYPWGYDPYGFNYRYSHYVFDNSEKASSQAYKDGFKTGKDDGKKDKSYDPQRSHYFQEAGFGNFAEVYRPSFERGYQDGYREGANQRRVG